MITSARVRSVLEVVKEGFKTSTLKGNFYQKKLAHLIKLAMRELAHWMELSEFTES